MKLTNADVQNIAETHNLQTETVKKDYLVAEEEDGGVVVFQTTYERTSHARFPEDGKLRELNSEYFWMTVINQSILPKAGAWDKTPLPYSIIYT